MVLPYRTGTVRAASPYGYRILNGVSQWHSGIDLVGTDRQIAAVMGGTVLQSRMVTDKSNKTWEWGNYVSIAGDDGMVIYYCHMDERKAVQGERVEAGDIIGVEGNTGYSFGSHCHFEVRDNTGTSVDPGEYLGIGKEIEKRLSATGVDAGKLWSDYYAEKVCGLVGLENQTRVYLDRYRYAPDLWRKLWENMR